MFSLYLKRVFFKKHNRVKYNKIRGNTTHIKTQNFKIGRTISRLPTIND